MVDVKISIDNNTIMRMKIIHIEYSEMYIQKKWQKSHSYPVTVVYWAKMCCFIEINEETCQSSQIISPSSYYK